MTIALETASPRPSQPERVRCGPADSRLRERARSARSPPATRRGQSQSPIAIGAHGPELLRYELVRSALRDSRMCVPEGLGLEAQGVTSGPLWDRATSTILSINGEDHTRLRRLVSKAFTPRSVGRLDTTITEIITELTDPLVAAGRCEVVEGHRPALPGAGHRRIARCTSRGREALLRVGRRLLQTLQLERHRARTGDPDGLERTRRLHRRHGRRPPHVAHRRPDLRADSRRRRRRPPGDEELRMLAAGILMAGTDTTRNQLAAAVDILCDHPEQWELLAERPELAMNAVEELMRFYPVIFGAMRMTMEDVEIEGVVIPAGTFVMVNTSAAQPRPRGVRRAGPPGHHPAGCRADADVRRRRALLPGRQPGSPRARRSVGGHDPPDGAMCAARRPRCGSPWSASPARRCCPSNSTHASPRQVGRPPEVRREASTNASTASCTSPKV